LSPDANPLPTVALVAPVCNGGPHYPVCFESLCRLDYPADRLEVHVIDDASTDGTRAYLQGQSPPGFVQRHFPAENLGRARVRNLGLEQARGEVVILLDGDLEVRPDFVRRHVAELRKGGRKAVVGRVEPAPWLPRTRLNRYLYEAPNRGAQQFGEGTPIGFQYLLTRNVSLWRDALAAGKPFEASFQHYGGEDTLFGYRLARQFPNGIYYSSTPVARHHHDRRLGAYLRDLSDYGRHNLPQIMARRPEIATPLAADFAWPLPGPFFRRKRRKGRLLFNGPGQAVARILLLFAPYPLSNALVRYLSVASVVRGLRRHLRGRG